MKQKKSELGTWQLINHIPIYTNPSKQQNKIVQNIN